MALCLALGGSGLGVARSEPSLLIMSAVQGTGATLGLLLNSLYGQLMFVVDIGLFDRWLSGVGLLPIEARFPIYGLCFSSLLLELEGRAPAMLNADPDASLSRLTFLLCP